MRDCHCNLGLADTSVCGQHGDPPRTVLKRGPDACPIGRVAASEIEAAVVDQLRGLLRAPEIVVGTWRAARAEIAGLTEAEVRDALERLDPLWDELFPAEQARIVQLLVERIELAADGIAIRLRTKGLTGIANELRTIGIQERKAA